MDARECRRPLRGRSGLASADVAAHARGSDAHASALVLELIDAQLTDKAPERPSGIVTSGDQDRAMMKPHVRCRVRGAIRVLAQAGKWGFRTL